MKLKLVPQTDNPLPDYSDEGGAIAFGTVAGPASPGAKSTFVSAIRGPSTIARGHRTYLDNPRLISTQPRKPPIAYGHRAFIEPKRHLSTAGEES